MTTPPSSTAHGPPSATPDNADADADADAEHTVLDAPPTPSHAELDQTNAATDQVVVPHVASSVEGCAEGAFYAQFPVSLDGSCPYCQSWNVQYLVLCPGDPPDVPTATTPAPRSTAAPEGDTNRGTAGAPSGPGQWEGSAAGVGTEGTVDASATSPKAASPANLKIDVSPPSSTVVDPTLSPIILRLLELKRAARVWASEACPEPSSFRCISCSYGFNIDWGRTNLETIFYWYLNPAGAATMANGEAVQPVVTDDASAASLHGHDAGYWGSEVNQYRLQQQSWDQRRQVGATPDVDARAAALDMVLSKIGAGAGAGAAAPSGVSTGQAADPGGAHSAAWVTEYKDYSVTGNFTELGGRFAAQSNDEYWEKKGIPKQREMRMIGHFMDPSQLEEDADAAATAGPKRKLTKREVQQFKERKKARKREVQRAYLKD